MKTVPDTLRLSLIILAATTIVACEPAKQADETVAPAATAEPEATTPTLADLLASPERAESDRMRDAGRHPAEVIEFLGIKPGMSVIDVIAAGGYYTEVLSLAVGKDGHVAAQNPARVLQMRDGKNEKELSARLANNRLPNVTRLDRELDDLTAADGPFDAGLTALNLHDIYNNYGEQGAVAALKAIFSTLKPGAVFGIIDHYGVDGNDNKKLHRIKIDDAIRVAEAAGFVLEAKSGLLHVHSDDMSEFVFAEGRRGHTHRFLLRLRKPV